ncbi:MAG: Cof protein [Acidimicrobiaceae bacterium]|nr:Cof protein [Acidimicrobiaceae bacterium]|tara:strand:+ start:184 stop:969 length:786 start_codon:yes stop_codon:yes gene_type:complete
MVCIDVDGTLVGSSGSPSEGVLATIAESISKGQKLVLSTARGAMGPTYEYAKTLNPHGWHIFHAGAALVSTGGQATREYPIPSDVIEVCTRVAMERDWALELYWKSNYRAFRHSDFTRLHAEMLGIDLQVGGPTDVEGNIVRLQFVVPEASLPDVREALDGTGTLRSATSPAMPGVCFVSITQIGVTKGKAITEISSELGIQLSDVMMVGDGHNDLDALRVVGHGVAMGNAEPEVIEEARYVVDMVDNDGLSEALEISWNL